MQNKAPHIGQDSPLIGRYVKIVQHHRRVGGRVGIVRDIFWKGEEPWLVVQLTSGLQIAVAYGWSDLPDESRPQKGNTPEILPSGLLDMATYWHSMTTRSRPKRSRKRRQATSP
jgi:hypothetical protein